MEYSSYEKLQFYKSDPHLQIQIEYKYQKMWDDFRCVYDIYNVYKKHKIDMQETDNCAYPWLTR